MLPSAAVSRRRTLTRLVRTGVGAVAKAKADGYNLGIATDSNVVLQPIIKSGGLFAEGGEALIWVTDDDRHIMVQLKAKMPVLRTLELFLKSYTPPTIPPE